MSVLEQDVSSSVVSHPEEIRADYELRIGKHINLHASARITPAGVISTGIAVAAIIFAAGYLAASTRSRGRR